MCQNLLFSITDGIATIVINRPAVRNALNVVGKGRALEMLLTGESISATEAMRIGLVNRVVASSELQSAAGEMAKKIMANAPQAVRFCMEAVHRGLNTTQDQGQLLGAGLFGECCVTDDMVEGTRAFLEKRAPVFKGK